MSSLAYPELSQHEFGKKLRNWVYTTCAAAAKVLTNDGKDATCAANSPIFSSLLLLTVQRIVNAADHLAGIHIGCKKLFKDGAVCKYAHASSTEGMNNSGANNSAYYRAQGVTHRALKEWLRKTFTPKYVEFLMLARMNYSVETFNSLINKYAPKRIHYHATHRGRLACAELDWNENISRQPLKIVTRKTSVSNNVRIRPLKVRKLPRKTHTWKAEAWKVMTDSGAESARRRAAYAKQEQSRKQREAKRMQARAAVLTRKQEKDRYKCCKMGIPVLQPRCDPLPLPRR